MVLTHVTECNITSLGSDTMTIVAFDIERKEVLSCRYGISII